MGRKARQRRPPLRLQFRVGTRHAAADLRPSPFTRFDAVQSGKGDQTSETRSGHHAHGGEKGTKNHEPRTIPMTEARREFLVKLKERRQPKETDFVSIIKDAKKSLQITCKKLNFPQFTHHDFRHFFATTCIESAVDIPTIDDQPKSRWLGHKDGAHSR